MEIHHLLSPPISDVPLPSTFPTRVAQKTMTVLRKYAWHAWYYDPGSVTIMAMANPLIKVEQRNLSAACPTVRRGRGSVI